MWYGRYWGHSRFLWVRSTWCPPPDAGKRFSDYEDNGSVAEGGDKSNNDLSHTVHVDIT